MNEGPKRRQQDSTLGRLVLYWPLILGAIMGMLSLGGYIATIKFMGDHMNKLDERFETYVFSQQKATEERNSILSKLTTLEEISDKRLSRLEQWRDDARSRRN